jgi:large conductance mechanosensitive channel
VLQEFKDFIAKGGIFEAAVGLIMALAFVPVVNAIIAGILMPIIAAIVGEPDFDGIKIGIGQADILIGTVITQIVSFIAGHPSRIARSRSAYCIDRLSRFWIVCCAVDCRT